MEYNIADILTKSISVKNFISELPIWHHGPKWILKDQNLWPQRNLGCLPSPKVWSGGEVGQTSSLCPVIEMEGPIPLNNYSSYSKLLGVTMDVMKAKLLFRGRPVEPQMLKIEAFQYLISNVRQK